MRRPSQARSPRAAGRARGLVGIVRGGCTLYNALNLLCAAALCSLAPGGAWLLLRGSALRLSLIHI